MTWYEIVIAVAGALGGFEFIKWLCNLIFNRKNNSRINDTVASNAEVEAEKNKAIAQVEIKNAEIELEKNRAVAEADAKKALEEAHAVERKQNEERIAELHKSLDTANEHITYLEERDAAKEKRFDEQTQKLRDVQGKLYESAQREVQYEKRIGELELELAKRRCDFIACPYRKPPTAHTPPRESITIDEYFATREVNIPIED